MGCLDLELRFFSQINVLLVIMVVAYATASAKNTSGWESLERFNRVIIIYQSRYIIIMPTQVRLIKITFTLHLPLVQ